MNIEIAIQALNDIIEMAEEHTLADGATLEEAQECDDAIASTNWFIIRAAKNALAAL